MRAIDMHFYIHCIIAVKYKAATIQAEWQEMLQNSLQATIEKNKHIVVALSVMPDHVHLVIRMGDHQSIDNMMKVICKESAAFINKQKLTPRKFEWQEGYISVSIGQSQIDMLVNFLVDQAEYHENVTFREEFIALLVHNEIEFEESGLFQDLVD